MSEARTQGHWGVGPCLAIGAHPMKTEKMHSAGAIAE